MASFIWLLVYTASALLTRALADLVIEQWLTHAAAGLMLWVSSHAQTQDRSYTSLLSPMPQDAQNIA
jgi:hypothetical protein